MDEGKAAEYLGIPIDVFNKIVEKDMEDKKIDEVDDPYHYVPYIQIEFVNYYSKKELDKWIEHRMFSN